MFISVFTIAVLFNDPLTRWATKSAQDKKSLEWREFKENMLSRVERLKYSSSRCLAEVLIFQAGHVILAEYFYLLFERK